MAPKNRETYMIKVLIRTGFTVLAVVFAFSNIIQAQTSPSEFPNIKIKNFGQMDTNYYRGAQPKKDDYQALKALGVKTVIDLQENPTDYEKPAVEALGMQYVNIPMGNGEYPKPEHIETFIKLVNDPATGAFFVHCRGGKHRTGVTGAVYRFTRDGWDYDRAYKEMKNYDFYSSWGYGDMKDFVVDYYAAKLKSDKTAAAAAGTAQAGN
jgi:protein tyrosine phosphatase (PTP) superfamily phosphohydrolase (DUF442 family)